MPCFADITTMEVGGRISEFVEPDSRASFLEAIIMADVMGKKLCVIGGGSNMLVSDEDFDGVVVRDKRRQISVLDEAAPVEEGAPHTTTVSATAGVHWDDFVSYCVRMGLAGVEALSGIPGTVGASVVQNIGAYGQEVASVVTAVEVWDREEKAVKTFSREDMDFGYRHSLLKATMYEHGPHTAPTQFYPSPRYIVLEVTFTLLHAQTNAVGMEQLARALGVSVGESFSIQHIRDAVLQIRDAKGMLEDVHRYENPWMAGTVESAPDTALDEGPEDRPEGSPEDRNKYSCGSFFMNPLLSQDEADKLPADAPRFPAVDEQGRDVVKTSAAWLIDHAGFKAGYKVAEDSTAGLSTKHTLALTNRGGAKTEDILQLARTIREGVRNTYGVTLVPEPVFIGVEL
ncbi:UDP-N-acetylenolpyruvoylglucosamine reductase [Alloscardovia macacae]|uniref:UDP-N-acetylenolpyruvoylglucosamine reductase n=1 Tax=Alloscardovia macacae TaxID=1160091 RepID=A0A1Y2SZ95_9BIFI|nr:FAD-binding protein [Alloscardovia macacae]OTA27302.1 UDP-N-acetylenolpyruvoylglucosamine reductase [Alloscardovia macacae]OTA29343.1 UDP-N-acetylenolpyruvoylglucosamine reductase [Alloscardovia macacae]